MCLLANGKANPGPIHETEEAVVLLDRFGSRTGHLLVVAKDHVEDVTELGVEQYLRLQRLAFAAAETLERALEPRRLFVASLGAPRAVPMSFPHFHLHVIPLYEEDESTRPARVFSWTDGVVVYDDDQAEELAQRLRSAWPARQDVPRRSAAVRPVWGGSSPSGGCA
jgi:diadenosine tetraphosphate (Ap4A) HIT family hydrolase